MLREILKKIFPTREIISKKGKLHFRRWCLLQTKFFSIYIHEILRSDEDDHCHDHPYSFLSLILFGGYVEYNEKNQSRVFLPLDFNLKNSREFHQLDLIHPTITFVITGPRNRQWGYWVDGHWVDNVTYRQLKNSGKL